MLKSIVLDFDGVILESVGVKGIAFARLFKNYPEAIDSIVNYHLNNGGVSRYEKFEYIYKNILHKTLNENEKVNLGIQFSELVFNEILSCPFVPGAEEFLNKYSRIYDLFIASGTPDEEIKEIVNRRGLTKYFKGVFGTPDSKATIINKIIQLYNYTRNQVVFIGDALSDYEGAKVAGIEFIARENPEALIEFPEPKPKIIFSLEELIF